MEYRLKKKRKVRYISFTNDIIICLTPERSKLKKKTATEYFVASRILSYEQATSK